MALSLQLRHEDTESTEKDLFSVNSVPQGGFALSPWF